ncbi:MAG TPA: glycoside hydrolase family 38 C-terminal domain-containing protein [Candidatus Brocadiia bacterium]|nr:glycoside hydrolase family 38 C-terminal domain-containing protein [Candidatus Brocadiia bacterium]
MAKSPARRKQKLTLHMIGNAHLDPVWLWNWQEGLQEARATFRSALDRMNETPDFVFTCSQAAMIRWIEEADPVMFAEIQKRVQEGRWCLVGGWWMEPDCNIPSGESFVRQALRSQLYFKAKFGRMATTGYNVDSFGHAWTLPQLLKDAGLSDYTFMRPGPHENAQMPQRIYNWRGPDGSDVLTFRIAHTYASWGGELEKHIRQAIASAMPGVEHMMVFYGVGNHGGGPTKDNIASIKKMAEELKGEAKIILSSPDAFFKAVRRQNPKLPTWKDEMQHHASGCYAAHSQVHADNRRAENTLCRAEKMSAAASTMLGVPYPAEQLGRAWENILYCQFHDIMGGTCIPASYEDVRWMQSESLAVAGRAFNIACQRLSARADTVGKGKPVFLFNPLAWTRQAIVKIDDGGPIDREYVLTDERGNETPLQWTHPETAVGRGKYVGVVELPSMGYRRLWVRREKPAAKPAKGDELTVKKLTMENSFLRVTVDGRMGCLSSLYDKRQEVELLSGPGAAPIVINDPSDTWSHGVFRFRDELGKFKKTSVKVEESGPVRAMIRVFSEWGKSTLRQDFMLYKDLDALIVRADVHWHEMLKMLKLSFPIAVKSPEATYSQPYGFIRRPADGEEEAGQQWIDVSGKLRNGKAAGVSLLNDSKYSYDIQGSDMRMTVLRSAVFSHHLPSKIEPGVTYAVQDQGPQTVNYALIPHAGDWRQADPVKRADELNSPVHFQFEHEHPGDLPGTLEFVTVKGGSVVATALKESEDGKALILRAFETQGGKCSASFALPTLGKQWKAAFGPNQVKTFRIPLKGAGKVVETDLLERPAK